MPVADGTRLVVDRWAAAGAGAALPGILLVHGLASNARLWDGMVAWLRVAGHDVAAVDLRGHGRSDKPDSGYDMATVADDLLPVLDALARRAPGPAPGTGPWAHPVVVGQSWGGNVVVELGWRRPDRLLGVVAVDGGAFELADRFPSAEEARLAMRPPPLAGTPARDVERMLRRAHPDWPEAAVAGTMANFEHRPDGTVAPWLSLDHHLQVIDGMWAQRPSERWATMAVPVLFLMADDGRGGAWAEEKRRAVAGAVAALARGAERWFVPADHDVHAQLPDQVGAAVHAAALEWAGERGAGP